MERERELEERTTEVDAGDRLNERRDQPLARCVSPANLIAWPRAVFITLIVDDFRCVVNWLQKVPKEVLGWTDVIFHLLMPRLMMERTLVGTVIGFLHDGSLAGEVRLI